MLREEVVIQRADGTKVRLVITDQYYTAIESDDPNDGTPALLVKLSDKRTLYPPEPSEAHRSKQKKESIIL